MNISPDTPLSLFVTILLFNLIAVPFRVLVYGLARRRGLAVHPFWPILLQALLVFVAVGLQYRVELIFVGTLTVISSLIWIGLGRLITKKIGQAEIESTQQRRPQGIAPY